MPHPNRSQNSPNLRLPTSQDLDTRLQPNNFKSMSTSELFLSNASIRRLSPSGRARPTAMSIADIFVRSLVIAGHCHDHSPRTRGLSTMSINHLTSPGAKCGNRCMARASKRLPTSTRMDGLRSKAEGLGVHRSRTQRMFNSSVAQGLGAYDREENCLMNTPTSGFSHRMSRQDAESDHPGRFEGRFQQLPHSTTGPGPIINNGVSTDQFYTASTANLEQNSCRQSTNQITERYRHYMSPREELYDYSSKIYQAALGTSLDWNGAADAIKTPLVFPLQEDRTRSAIELPSVKNLLEALWNENECKSNHYLFALYRELPHPGVSYLSKRSRGALLRRLAQPRDRRWVDARRFLALVDDMVVAGLPLSRSLWTTAMHLAGRATGKVRKPDLVRAIGLWQQMEHIGGIESDGVVFGVLFDIAIKAGQFTVADRFVEEMRKRNFQFDRMGKVSTIYYYGLLRDTDSIRRAFNEFVAAGQIVETLVLNCLMASFLRAGDIKMAESLYRRMMQTHATSQTPNSEQLQPFIPGLTPELVVYRKRAKKLNRILQLSASLKDNLPEHHQALQDAFSMGPDTRTFHILLSYHAHQSGSLEDFKSILGDMERTFAVPPRGMVYLLLFEGFAHNGRRKKGWNAEKLWTTWKTYLRALYESKTRLNNASYAQPETLVWENPLDVGTTAGATKSSITQPNTSNKLYTPLPSTATDLRDGHSEHNQSNTDDTEIGADDDTADGIYMEGPLYQRKQDHQLQLDELEEMERRIENGVFLGRRMILIILRAFGNCCGPNDVMEVWLRMESIWQPEKRKGLDVLAVKEELEKQMNRAK